MKKSLITILVFISLGISSADNLWKVIPSPVSYPLSLTKVIFMDSLTGWASGDSGIVIHTTNGGANWDFQNTGVKGRIDNLFFLDKLKGWALSIFSQDTVFGSYVLSTKDGGITWKRDSLSFPGRYLSNIYFLDSLKGFVSASDAPIFYTLDGGINWVRAIVDTFSFYPGGGFTFYNEKLGLAYGGSFDIVGLVWKTTDGGINWSGLNTGMDPIKKIHFYDSLNVFGISGDLEVGITKYTSTDAGSSWHSEALPDYGVPHNLSYRTPSEAWIPLIVAFPPIYFYVTKDSGKTWSTYPVPDDLTIYDMSFPDSLHGYAVGLDGVILKYTPQPNLIKEETSKIITDFSLDQNYPNPFNSSTEISFTINLSGEMDLSLFDMLGRKIKTLHKGELGNGKYKITLDAAELPSGIYYYRLTSGHSSLTKKAILLK